jgi:septal ring factor EnvC (AmiA/AmiB activator)
MWLKLVDFARHIFNFGQETRRHSEDIKELQREVRQVTAALQHLAYEHQRVLDALDRMKENNQHLQQSEAQERDRIALRLENEMLKFERRLPPAKRDDE